MTATAPPTIPSLGTMPKPKINSGDTGISTTAPTQATTAGSHMLPVPRMTLASELNNQIRIAPANNVSEYASAAVSEPSAPPIAA